MGKEYNWIYQKLVESENDLAGAIAYSLYKRHKIAIILVAIWREKTDFALEVLKIGGALLAGYFAGFHKGKANVLEKQRQRDEE